jgi:hypothetical protein
MADEPGAYPEKSNASSVLVEMSPASSRPVMARVRLTWPEGFAEEEASVFAR